MEWRAPPDCVLWICLYYRVLQVAQRFFTDLNILGKTGSQKPTKNQNATFFMSFLSRAYGRYKKVCPALPTRANRADLALWHLARRH